jgi:Domain of unknown function (DUF4440)
MKTAFIILCLLYSFCSFSQTKEQLEVQKYLELLKMQMIEPEARVLENILHEKLIYGHSNGHNESKKDVIEVLTGGKSDYVKLDFSNLNYTFSKNMAVVRCDFIATLIDKAKNTSELNIKAIMVLIKEKNEWKLFSRQGFKLPALPK